MEDETIDTYYEWQIEQLSDQYDNEIWENQTDCNGQCYSDAGPGL